MCCLSFNVSISAPTTCPLASMPYFLYCYFCSALFHRLIFWNQNIRAEKVREYIWKSILHISPVARKNFLAVSATSAFFLDAKHSLWKEAKAIVHKIPYKKYSSRQLHWKFYLCPSGRSKSRQMGVTFIGDNQFAKIQRTR